MKDISLHKAPFFVNFTQILRVICLAGAWLSLACCSPQDYLTPLALQEFIIDEDRGLVKQVVANNYILKLTYKPTDLWMYQEVQGVAMDSSTFLSLRKKYAGNYYFILSISKDQHEALSPAEAGMVRYSELLETLSFRMDRHVGLITSLGDTIQAGDFMLDRTYGASNATSLLFSFSKKKIKGQDWIEFTMSEFGLGTGAQRFRFRLKDLESVPRLKFEIRSDPAG